MEMRNREEHLLFEADELVALIAACDWRTSVRCHQTAKMDCERDKIYEEVIRRWNEKRRRFTQFMGVKIWTLRCDHARGIFHDAQRSRMVSTIKAIMKSRKKAVVSDGLAVRYPPETAHRRTSGREGTFNMCSFGW